MIRVTKQNPCQVCMKNDWCYTSDDGTIAFCTRVESRLKAKNGAWMHIIKERDKTDKPYIPPPPTRLKKFDAVKYHEQIRAEWDHVWADGTALSLGVDEEALERLAPGWDNFNKAVGYPMRDHEGKVVGIRLRNWKADKWAVAGSSDGLFFDPLLTLGDDKELVVCEGPTDTAAGYTLGLSCVGRSSCATGADLLRALCARLGARLVTIIADNDGWRENQYNDTLRRPGIDGAVSLGKALCRMYRVVITPKKDLRQWLGSGITLKDFKKHADVSRKFMS